MTPGSIGPQILDLVRAERHYMIELLERLTLAESPSSNAESQQRIRELLSKELEALRFSSRLLPGLSSGGQIYARPRDRRRGDARQLIVGH
ncbi:MAG TPA: hypothetical protein VIV14_11510, partial [Gammaproteobacteria bacterium]